MGNVPSRPLAVPGTRQRAPSSTRRPARQRARLLPRTGLPAVTRPRRRRLGTVTLGLLALVSLAACGSSASSLDTARIEHAVAASILAQRGLHTTVSCPSNIPVKKGHTFTCTAKLDVGNYPVTVIETTSQGRVRYENSRPLVALNIAKVQNAIAASIVHQRGLKATVSCPQQVLQQAGVSFTCTAVVPGNAKRFPFLVTQVNSSGRVRYEGR